MKQLLIAGFLLSTAIPSVTYAETYAEHEIKRNALLEEFARNKATDDSSEDARWSRLLAGVKTAGAVKTASGTFVLHFQDGTGAIFTPGSPGSPRIICIESWNKEVLNCKNFATSGYTYAARSGEGSPWTEGAPHPNPYFRPEPYPNLCGVPKQDELLGYEVCLQGDIGSAGEADAEEAKVMPGPGDYGSPVYGRSHPSVW